MAMETLPSGTILHGRYRIERVLGSGGFGHVYIAIDMQTKTQYAIKEYLVTGSSGKVQLEHEERVLSQLHHPNLPAFQDAFDERGRYYMVLDYIEGNDLTDYIRIVRQKNDVVPLAQVLTWLLSVANAVSFLHSQQPPIIHRDIKPDNIRITSDGKAILVDLGNAKAAADGARTLFFIRHQGTPGYAPLEQYPGGAGTDARSDVYALGGTLYFVLTTHEPPSVSTRNQAIQQNQPDLPSLQDLLAHNPPEGSTDPTAGRQFRLGISKPSKPAPRHSRHLAQLGTLPPELLEKLNSIIKHAMEMKPRDRYQSVADFSNDLRLVLAALPSSTQPSSSRPPRNIDPHSTQPDLPLLFEQMQNTKGPLDPATLDTTAMPDPQPPAPAAATRQCPYCNGDLSRNASFCPHCGKSLTNSNTVNSTLSQPPAPGYQSSNSPAGGHGTTTPQDISGEATIVITPPLPRSPGSGPSSRMQEPPAGLSGDAPQQNHRASKQAIENLALSAPLQVPPKPFMQASPPAPVAASARLAPQPAAPIVQMNGSTIQTAHSAPTGTSTNTRKFLIFTAIILVVILLAILMLLFIATKGHPHQAAITFREFFHPIQAQVLTHERNVSLCITPSITPALARLWPRSPGIPSSSRITERMDGPRVRYAPGN
ncbi:MAG TPA: protein kinase [Ktedonobacteraceae bacterium]|jgi:serine/threonine protein kinase|nr:protein kinase [Ktedonobacteraceae bacterium]